MKLIKSIGLTVIAMGILATQAMAEDYEIDNDGYHASVHFKVTHLGFSYIVGRFNAFEGTFSYNVDDPSASSTSVTIQANSVDTNHAERDKHLKSEEFLEVDTYPTITFVSTSVDEISEDELDVVGNLTIHGITKSVTLDVEAIGHGTDPWDGYRRGFEGTTTVSSDDFDLPDWVGEIEITVIVEGVRQ